MLEETSREKGYKLGLGTFYGFPKEDPLRKSVPRYEDHYEYRSGYEEGCRDAKKIKDEKNRERFGLPTLDEAIRRREQEIYEEQFELDDDDEDYSDEGVESTDSKSDWGERSYATRDKDSGLERREQINVSQKTMPRGFHGTGVDKGYYCNESKWPVLGGLLFLVGLIAIPFAVNKGVNEHREKQQIIKQTSFSREEARRDEKLPSWLTDYSLSPDKSQVVFSQQIDDRCYNYITGIFNSPIVDIQMKKRFRIFLSNVHNGERINLLDKADWRTKDAISWEDLVAPLFSSDGKKIAFAVTREDHPSSVYVVDSNGKNFKRLSSMYGGSSTVVFGWVQDNKLFIWRHYNENADFFNPLEYRRGESSLVDVVNSTSPKSATLDFRSHEKQIYVPPAEIRIKYVSASITNSLVVRDYIITRKK